MTPNLSIEVVRAFNKKTLIIQDTSHNCENLENYLLQVLPPTSGKWVDNFVIHGFNLVLNSSSLYLNKVNEREGLMDLPDGIYEIKQSYKPNIHTLQHYFHLRTTSLRYKASQLWKKLISDECKISREEYKANREKLREIDEYILASEFMAEECHDKERSVELYKYTQQLMEDYSNECGC